MVLARRLPLVGRTVQWEDGRQ